VISGDAFGGAVRDGAAPEADGVDSLLVGEDVS
jgi:hypothetical protein